MSVVTLPRGAPGIVELPNTSAVAAHPVSLAKGWEARMVELPATINDPPVEKSPASYKAVEVMIELAVPAKPTEVLPTTVYKSVVTVLLSLSLSWPFLSSNLPCLQNSTELTKKPSNGPVLHSYLLSSVEYLL